MLFAFKIVSLPVLTRPDTRTFLQLPDPSRPKVKNPYPSDPARDHLMLVLTLILSYLHLLRCVWSPPADPQSSSTLKNCPLEGALGQRREKLEHRRVGKFLTAC